MTTRIQVHQLGKRFTRHNAERLYTLQSWVARGFRGIDALRHHHDFWALRGISFEIDAGKMVGIIGANGAGKSTLLRLLGKMILPDEGKISMKGHIDALIDLGAGFHSDLTGRDNLYINAVISGLTRQQARAQFDSIVSFAELENFIDSPLRTYSTGMQLRLAFAIAIHIRPEILLIDEVLSVGDMRFQRKCLEKIQDFRSNGSTIVLVSHDIATVGQLCDEVIWLSEGRISAYGPAKHVIEQYRCAMQGDNHAGPLASEETRNTIELGVNRFGTQEVEITKVRLLDSEGTPVHEMESGDELQVEIHYQATSTIQDAVFGVSITSSTGTVCFDTSTQTAGFSIGALQQEGTLRLSFERLDLVEGAYFIDVGAYSPDWATTYDYHWRAYPIEVKSFKGEKGIYRPPHSWSMGER